LSRPAIIATLLLITTLLLIVPATAASSARPASVRVTVDGAAVLNPDPAPRLGINTNYWWDSQDNRPVGARPLAGALRELNVTMMRYPGGEEADGYLWSSPPFTAPAPTLARVGPDDWPSNDPRYWARPGDPTGGWSHPVYDFDRFMADCEAAACEPVIVVAEDGIYKPPSSGGTSLSRPQALANAAAWVHYANVVRGYGIRYWEIGNETWRDGYMGADPGPARYGRDVVEFSRAMKAIDPGILIGVNGNSRAWFDAVLAEAGTDVDFLAVHSYPSHGMSFSAFQKRGLATSAPVDEASAALADQQPPVRDRLFVAVTETGVLDVPDDLGSGLIGFSALGDLMNDRRVRYTVLWTTRWTEVAPGPSADALDDRNELRPLGRALALWGEFGRGPMVAATADRSDVLAYASLDRAGGRLAVFLVNTSGRALTTSLELRGVGGVAGALSRWVFSGSSPSDTNPSYGRRSDVTATGRGAGLTLEPYSVTVLTAAVG
jgi:hypothetical protein